MAGYLDQYGVADSKREGRTRKIILAVVLVVVLGVTGYFTFRTWSEERVINEFLSLLSKKDYDAAYRLWGCTPETPCKFYGKDKFEEDWGPKGAYAKADAAKVSNVDFCDKGVVFAVSFPGSEDPAALWVERSTNVISFAPWAQCPGRHWNFKQFFKNLFS